MRLQTSEAQKRNSIRRPFLIPKPIESRDKDESGGVRRDSGVPGGDLAEEDGTSGGLCARCGRGRRRRGDTASGGRRSIPWPVRLNPSAESVRSMLLCSASFPSRRRVWAGWLRCVRLQDDGEEGGFMRRGTGGGSNGRMVGSRISNLSLAVFSKLRTWGTDTDAGPSVLPRPRDTASASRTVCGERKWQRIFHH